MKSLEHAQILVVDDDSAMQELLADFFRSQGARPVGFNTAQPALDYLSNHPIDLVITDLKMPQMNGMEFIEKIKEIHPETPVIMITAFGSIESAIDATKRGAFDYIVKPFKLGEVALTASRALEYKHLKSENVVLRREVKKSWGVGDILGKSPQMRSIFELVQRVSQATANILIMGESGTGKEVVARAIHNVGPRANKPFVAINCTAIPDTLLESELFGHAKGSFTGAIQRKLGLFEEAAGGTVFLDEIGDMDLMLQAKLLRVIQERKIRPVGDTHTRDIDVRLIAATHKDLKAAIKDGRFREDLFYRLSVIPVLIPPLRHRKEDIPLLAEHFLTKYAGANNSVVKGFSREAIQKLAHMPWEGNVRELENLIERTVVLCNNPLVGPDDIPGQEVDSADQFFGKATSDFPTIEDLEKRYIQLILEKTGGRKDKASHILGINRRTLYRKEREYGFAESNHPEDLELGPEDEVSQTWLPPTEKFTESLTEKYSADI